MLEPVTGEEKEDIFDTVLETQEYKTFRDYFEEECGYELDEKRVTKIPASEREFNAETDGYVATFEIDDGRQDTLGELNISLESDYSDISALGGIDHLEGPDQLISKVEWFEYDEGEIQQVVDNVDSEF